MAEVAGADKFCKLDLDSPLALASPPRRGYETPPRQGTPTWGPQLSES
eukprot:CAMPEP_0172775722 /NCGR_PEP_ID=MMETSP1074-20121228/198488_1 /TAXON_ID=2916 /ORGANISM="Ceratium fusus, Strain PA161109" /LENGTH=47 /DNA_ID= /DNA_START= /DNA_END= /DNA_ORIENTATION=